MKGIWWKILSILLLLYAVVRGFTVEVPDTNIGETMRNVFFHVGMWFAMIAVFARSFSASIKVLGSGAITDDIDAGQSAATGLFFGFLGIITGMIWATFTWGKPWANDPHLNGAAIGIIIYLAYFILRSSIDDDHKKARISAVYNIFAFVLLIVLVGLLPRMSSDTLHPGSRDGNPAFGDMDSAMRYVFYPTLAGWILLGLWVAQLRVRIKKIEFEIENKETD
jgi:heme exporter protein C